MFSDYHSPSVNRTAPFPYAFTSSFDTDTRAAFQTLPINLSPEEIRALVQEVLG